MIHGCHWATLSPVTYWAYRTRVPSIETASPARGLRQRDFRAVGVAGQTEVHNHRLALLVEHDVRRLQVAMDDPALMSFLQGQGQLAYDVGCPVLVPRLAGLNSFRQRVPFDVRDGQVVRLADLPYVVHRTDLRMTQRRRRAGFAVEPFDHLRCFCGREPRHFRSHQPI